MYDLISFPVILRVTTGSLLRDHSWRAEGTINDSEDQSNADYIQGS